MKLNEFIQNNKIKQEQSDFNNQLIYILKKIENKEVDLSQVIQAIKDYLPILKSIQDKINNEVKVDISGIEKAINNIKLPAPQVNVEPPMVEVKPPKVKIENKTKTKDYTKAFKSIIEQLNDLEEAIKGINISISSSGGSATKERQDDIITKLQQIADNTDELEIKADQINLNTDTLEALQQSTIDAINAQSSVSYHTNEIYEDGTDTYFCKESKDGEWYIMKIDEDSVFTHATNKNNDTINDYQSARSNVTTLTYGTYNEAF